MVPDEDPDLEPTIHIRAQDERVVPFEIMRWFMEEASDQVARCRAAMAAEFGSSDHSHPSS
ncbi:hypothetical protein ACFQY4_17680 [Catellatospora bangladeshensis]|nr:hypothetical protein [Catellatospora bangladeshensis]